MNEDRIEYRCCFCKQTVANSNDSSLDPCSLIVVSNFDQERSGQKEQQFFCHFECFRRLVDDDGILYIADDDFPTVGEVPGEE